ncbi:hypothetical protein DS878_02945 [Marinobacter sp. F3R11]|nr:hypothetical protein DS878_02945 [Marinobacter sp. F3R11]
MHMTAQYPTDSEAYNAMKAAPPKHCPTIDATTRNILERLLVDLMHMRDFEFDTETNLNGYVGMDVCTSVLARLIDGPLPDNVTALAHRR